MKRAFAELAPRACRSLQSQTTAQARAGLVSVVQVAHALRTHCGKLIIVCFSNVILLSALQVALPCATVLQWQPVAQLHHLHSQQTTHQHQTATSATGDISSNSHVLQRDADRSVFSLRAGGKGTDPHIKFLLMISRLFGAAKAQHVHTNAANP